MNNSLLPSVSIIIPVRNEELYIEKCLECIIKQTYPRNKLEILVIDGQSRDNTQNFVINIIDRCFSYGGPIIRLIDNPKLQRVPALNIGIKEAKHDVVVRIDARTIIPEDYIEKLINTLLSSGADNVGGAQKTLVNTNASNVQVLTQHAVGLALSNSFGMGNSKYRLGKKSEFVDTVYLFFCWKKIFDIIGFFDESISVISEDSDMDFRIRKNGGKVYLNKDVKAFYYPRDNFVDLVKLYVRYGGAKAGNLITRGRLTAWRQFVPPTCLLFTILLPILALLNISFGYIWLTLFIAYSITDITVSLYLINQNKIFKTNSVAYCSSLFCRLLMVFPVMHFSWAIGFWIRLFQRTKQEEYWEY